MTVDLAIASGVLAFLVVFLLAAPRECISHWNVLIIPVYGAWVSAHAFTGAYWLQVLTAAMYWVFMAAWVCSATAWCVREVRDQLRERSGR